MAIYTKTGDAGTTALFDGTRVPKNSLRVDTYGTFDELNAQVSVCEKLVVSPDNKHVLHTLQHQLFRLCAEVATPHVENLSESSNLISQQDISELEYMIDDYTNRLPQQHSFILSGNYLSAAELHVARTICRRGERLLISLGSVEPIRDEVRKFINRLSDALYILSLIHIWELTDMLHIKAIELIAKSLRKSVDGDYDAREEMSLAQYIACLLYTSRCV